VACAGLLDNPPALGDCFRGFVGWLRVRVEGTAERAEALVSVLAVVILWKRDNEAGCLETRSFDRNDLLRMIEFPAPGDFEENSYPGCCHPFKFEFSSSFTLRILSSCLEVTVCPYQRCDIGHAEL
jgi:hypothetical protein